MNPLTTIRIENRTIFKILVSITIFIALLNIAAAVSTQLIWIATAFFLAIALNPAVELMRKIMPKHNRVAALATVLLLLVMGIFFLLYAFLPLLIQQTAHLIAETPKAVQQIQSGNNPVSELFARYNLEHQLQEGVADITKALAGATGSVLSIAQGVFSGFAAVVTIITVAIFMLLEGPRWMNLFWRYHPEKSRDRNHTLIVQMYQAVSSYFSGILVIATISSICSMIMMTIVGIPYAIPLGILVGLFGLIPFVGATIAAVLVVIVALFTSTGAGIAMGIYFVVYQQVENNVLQPVVQGRSTELSPLLVTIAILLGASIAGLFGALVAIPVAACIKVLVVHWFQHHMPPHEFVPAEVPKKSKKKPA